MVLLPEQVKAIQDAKQLLVASGLELPTKKSPEEFLASLHTSPIPVADATPNFDTDLCYLPARAGVHGIQQEFKLTRQSVVHAVIDHPLGVIVEYSESGGLGNAIAHRFNINPLEYYSLGDTKGGHKNVNCYLLESAASLGEPIKCSQTKVSCRCVKHCEFSIATSQDSLQAGGGHNSHSSLLQDVRREVFEKTLALYVTIISQGCSVETEAKISAANNEDTDDDWNEEFDLPFDICAKILPKCKGKIVLKTKNLGQSELRYLNEYDIEYLKALIEDNYGLIRNVELEAKHLGYGPLCRFNLLSFKEISLPTALHQHIGTLQHGILQPVVSCKTRYKIYVPNDLWACVKILLVSRGAHSHPDPSPARTPLTIIEIFNSFLRGLDQHLANTTPRRLALDLAFVSALGTHIAWAGIQDPPLSALHPSFGNMNHTLHLINILRKEYFPSGTGLKGAMELYKQHKLLPRAECYVCVVETFTLPGYDPFQIIICMLPCMSELLMATKRPTIDTSFKRPDGFEEFEIEAWFSDVMKSLVCAHMFVTSQSAPAHLHMFKLVFKIAETDTGKPVWFQHIHGTGYEVVVADAHKGQALGRCWAALCQSLTELGPKVYISL
ncbi:hypothetical protein K439DRAFT_1613228 [Ramaria rubella]|nr:hypothetical protein K439DRAFT_1613228 [Ramaria rubella]